MTCAQRPLRYFSLGCLLLACASALGESPTPREADHRAIFHDLPADIQPAARYLFYLHGQIIEIQGNPAKHAQFGVYEYDAILNAFADKGFTVISEVRPRQTDEREYAGRVAAQIKRLLEAKVPADHITVVGASKGAVIAMIASSALRNRDLNFVLLANCNDYVATHFEIDLHGNVLSIYDVNDPVAQSCQPFFARATGLNRQKEIELKLATGHGILYRPLPQWVDPIVEWANADRK